MAKSYPRLAAVDLGSSKIAVLISEMTPQGLELIGVGEAESHGIRKGVIVAIDATVHALTKALKEAGGDSKTIDHLVVGVSGSHIQTLSSTGMVPIRDKEVREADLLRVMETASAVTIPLDREVLQAVPQEFIVDGQDGIHLPVGMYGKRLEVHLLLLTAAITPLENARRCLQKAGMKATQFLSSALASAQAVSTEEERMAGVCVIDIGAASTDLAVFREGALQFVRSLPMGGLHLTNDLAVGLKTTLSEAQKLKHLFGADTTWEQEVDIEIPGLSGCEPRRIQKHMLATILQPRLDEILMMVKSELSKEGIDETLPSGVILTGGSALLKGIMASAERVFRLPVRIGRPGGLGGLGDRVTLPSFASSVGLLQLGFKGSDELQFYQNLYQKKGVKRVHLQLQRWVKDFF